MNDLTPEERARKAMQETINGNPKTYEELVEIFGKEEVWTTDELRAQFDVRGFAAPFVVVKRKADGVQGVLTFQHDPRFYFAFKEVP